MNTPNIGLTELANGQANYLNANQSFAVIDSILQTRAISKTLTAAPGSPADGDVYIMQSAWSGITTLTGAASAAGDIAFYRSSIGVFKAIRPKEGWKIELASDDITYRFDGSTWSAWSTGGGGGVSLPVVQALSSTRNLVLADVNTFNVNSTGTDYTVTIQPQSAVTWTADAEIHFLPTSTGNIVITGGTGVSLNGVSAGSITLSTAFGAATIKRIASDSWWLGGVAGQVGASGDWATAGGTANALTLTPVVARESYVAGDQFRARISVTNTGAMTVNVSGLGVKTCKTVTGADTPAGYIRTDADTTLTYDGTNFIVDREVEYGSNGNGKYWRYADGRLDCTSPELSIATSVAMGSFFRNSAAWTLPANYIATTDMSPESVAETPNTAWGGSAQAASTSSINLRVFCLTNTTVTYHGKCTGRWY